MLTVIKTRVLFAVRRDVSREDGDMSIEDEEESEEKEVEEVEGDVMEEVKKEVKKLGTHKNTEKESPERFPSVFKYNLGSTGTKYDLMVSIDMRSLYKKLGLPKN